MWTEVCLGDGKHSHTRHQTCDRKQLISRGTTAVCVRVCVCLMVELKRLFLLTQMLCIREIMPHTHTHTHTSLF